ncbi:MAG: hypothetical protein CL609_23600 [Anaerolineaceae bacterium]|nr:hypothetical protein [Anaerolineaceae bacterium]
MSGGPIFGFRKEPGIGERYWLIAVQSRWGKHSHEIAACPTKLLGEFLMYFVEQQKIHDQTP